MSTIYSANLLKYITYGTQDITGTATAKVFKVNVVYQASRISVEKKECIGHVQKIGRQGTSQVEA